MKDASPLNTVESILLDETDALHRHLDEIEAQLDVISTKLGIGHKRFIIVDESPQTVTVTEERKSDTRA